ncbi:hypothetical protein DN752_13735 [Echinicola strongylocentroti]|uniref:Uncharacterized protein n=1 Tax=Echinicola strongylocentroti TaxID=1795355 RepID=A0A2Z4IJ00_9BACT|nr:hypothetical protein [Echinicola strongylocentroti]AWW31101.1 hypothetical protein DN752_13735 [Echinicola strongylocentroti]
MNISSFLIAVALVMGLAACGGKQSSESTTTESVQSNETPMEKEVAFTVAEKYFVKNDAPSLSDPKIETAEEFAEYFGSATVMGEDGKPTAIDFQTQYVIAVTKPATNVATELKPVSLVEDGEGNVTLSYSVEEGEAQSHSIKPTLIVIVGKSADGDVTVEEVE